MSLDTNIGIWVNSFFVENQGEVFTSHRYRKFHSVTTWGERYVRMTIFTTMAHLTISVSAVREPPSRAQDLMVTLSPVSAEDQTWYKSYRSAALLTVIPRYFQTGGSRVQSSSGNCKSFHKWLNSTHTLKKRSPRSFCGKKSGHNWQCWFAVEKLATIWQFHAVTPVENV